MVQTWEEFILIFTKLQIPSACKTGTHNQCSLALVASTRTVEEDDGGRGRRLHTVAGGGAAPGAQHQSVVTTDSRTLISSLSGACERGREGDE